MNAPAPLARWRDPIVAVATAPGRGAVGIVRASGADLSPLIDAICGRTLTPRSASFGAFLDAHGEAIDQGLAIHFPAPHSFTGESVLELQAHGGPVVLQLLVARCLQAGQSIGLRLAEPGEFTQRAFLNGKLDLTQAEAVADLIDASTEAAARSASRSLGGALSREAQSLGSALVELRALVEATLDFPDEEIDFLDRAGAAARLTGLRGQLKALLARARQGALLREGLRVVLAGQPNVGKSSLLNALAGAELAIVTPIPGTTRDRISETIQIHGVPLHITDTAGLREQGADEVERIGIARSWEAISSADAVILLHDLSRCGEATSDDDDRLIASQVAAAGVLPERVVHVYNKADLPPGPGAANLPEGLLRLSARSGLGLDALRDALLQRAGVLPGTEGSFIARTRHVQALRQAEGHVELACQHLLGPVPALELLAEELRLAHEAVMSLTGYVGADDLLGEIFGRFCIGK